MGFFRQRARKGTAAALAVAGLAVLVTALAVAAPATARHGKLVAVARVVDGDTIVLRNGRRVRLVQIDTPETHGQSECYGAKATAALARLLPRGTKVRLVADPRLDRVDRYGRLLRYVFKRRTNVNLQMVKRGAASVWFYRGDRGRYARALDRAARHARARGRGLWGACPGTVYDPLHGVDTSAAHAATGARCDPSYPDFCIPPPPPDLDCADIGRSFTVRRPDPHGFDGDGDGRGCESYG